MLDYIIYKMILGFVLGIVICFTCIFLYCFVIEPLIIKLKWKQILQKQDEYTPLDQKILRYTQLFPELGLTPKQYVISKKTLYDIYQNLCEQRYRNILTMFKQLPNNLDKLEYTYDKNNIMSTFETLCDTTDLIRLIKLEHYFKKQLTHFSEIYKNKDTQKYKEKEYVIMNKLKNKILELKIAKLFSIINCYYKHKLLNLEDLEKIVNILKVNMTERELRTYINSILITKGDNYNEKN